MIEQSSNHSPHNNSSKPHIYLAYMYKNSYCSNPPKLLPRSCQIFQKCKAFRRSDALRAVFLKSPSNIENNTHKNTKWILEATTKTCYIIKLPPQQYLFELLLKLAFHCFLWKLIQALSWILSFWDLLGLRALLFLTNPS